MKRSLIVAGIAVVVILVVAVAVIMNLGSVLKTAIERIGSQATQAKVTLDRADVSLTSGTGSLRGLTVGNPAGFTTPSAITPGEVTVALDVATVKDDVIVIKEIVVGAPEVTYEFASGTSNLDTLRGNVQAYAGGRGGAAPAGEQGIGRRFVIRDLDLYVRDGRVHVSAPFLAGQNVGAALPAIHLKDIGMSGGKVSGASAAEVTEKVMLALSQAATQAVGTLDVAGIRDALKGRLGGATEMLGEGAGSGEKIPEGGRKLFGN